MYFSPVIDRTSVSVVIVRGLCDVLSKMNSVNFNGRTKCALTVSCRRTDKLGCRSKSLSFFASHATVHVSSYLYTFRCLVGHVCER